MGAFDISNFENSIFFIGRNLQKDQCMFMWAIEWNEDWFKAIGRNCFFTEVSLTKSILQLSFLVTAGTTSSLQGRLIWENLFKWILQAAQRLHVHMYFKWKYRKLVQLAPVHYRENIYLSLPLTGSTLICPSWGLITSTLWFSTEAVLPKKFIEWAT